MHGSVRGRALVVLSGAAVGVGIAAGVVVSAFSAGHGPSCASFSSCVVDPSDLLNAFHVGSAGVLLVLSALVAALTIAGRSEDRPRLVLGLAGLVVLLAMAALGALFATGAVPTSASALQYLLLAAYVAVNARILVRSHRWNAGGATSTPEPPRLRAA